MPRDRGTTDGEFRGELTHRERLCAEATKHVAANRVSERIESVTRSLNQSRGENVGIG